jgi:hypothetical protein
MQMIAFEAATHSAGPAAALPTHSIDQAPGPARCVRITETNRIQLVLFGMHNRTCGPCLAAINRILISLVAGDEQRQEAQQNAASRSKAAAAPGVVPPPQGQGQMRVSGADKAVVVKAVV